jgi:hypothetical protein
MSESKIRAVRRLVRAAATFQDVVAACDFASSLSELHSDRAYGPFLSGILVTYTRPFLESAGLGPLPPEFERFPPNSTLVYTHEDVKNGRHWLAAHSDLKNSASLLGPDVDENEQSKIRITVDQAGLFAFATPVLLWKPENLPKIRELAVYQHARTRAKVQELLIHLAAGKTYAPGQYFLGKDFPATEA